jgi:hypothetical protein
MITAMYELKELEEVDGKYSVTYTTENIERKRDIIVKLCVRGYHLHSLCTLDCKTAIEFLLF